MRSNALPMIVLGIVLALSVGTASATLDNYFLDVANVKPTSDRNHTYTFTFDGTLNVTIPAGFSAVSYTGSPNVTATDIQWYSANSTTVQLILNHSGSCAEGTTWQNTIYLNSVQQDTLALLCIEDESLVSLKFENGHGESAWLDEPYFTYPFTVHTLVRVFEHANYFSGDVGENAQITCTVPNDMFISGKFSSSSCGSNNCTITKTWEELDTSLFRVWSFMQDTNYSYGSSYWVNCTDITWNFTNEGIRATLGYHSLESRPTEPFSFAKSNTDRVLNYTLTNNEVYTVYELFLTFFYEGKTITRELVQLNPGESETFLIEDIDDDSTVELVVDFIPSWEYNSLSPVHYQQTDTYTYTLRPPRGTGGSSLYSGVVCRPSGVTTTTRTSMQQIRCQNYDNVDYRVLVTKTGDLEQIASYVHDTEDYTFIVKKLSTKYLNVEFDYSALARAIYNGTLVFTSEDVTLNQSVPFRITAVPGLETNITDAQLFFGSLYTFDIPTASVILGESLTDSALDLPRGGYIPKIIFFLIGMLIFTAVFIYIRRNYKPSKWIYIIYAIILIILLIGCAFTV